MENVIILIPNKWYLVTGEEEKIYTLAREAYFADDTYKQTNDKNGFIHTENLILIDKKRAYKRGIQRYVARRNRTYTKTY